MKVRVLRPCRPLPALLCLLALLAGIAAAAAAGPKSGGAALSPRAQQAADALTAYLDSLDGEVSVACMRLSDGFTFAYREDTGYYAASLLKAPYALWLCRRAEAGEIDLDAPLPARGSAPAQTARQAMRAMIARSDDSATGQLYSLWPAEAGGGFTAFLAGIGVDRPQDALTEQTRIHGELSARDCLCILQALQDYFSTGTSLAASLQQDFMDAGHHLLPDDWPMAKKYGSWDGALHDMAIVYNSDPYLIAVMSDWGVDGVEFPEEGASRIAEIGLLAGDLMGMGGG